MKGIASAATCGIVEGKPIVDLTSREETDLLPRVTLATICGRDEVILVELQNRLHNDHLSDVMDSAKATCADVYECLAVAVQQHLKACAPILGSS
uniref:RNase_PH_C domain-containing protein n=1 Tax=Caenorhabditis japonica TaxID=281687 RepID=A0A8R1EAW2_CAEJA